MDRLYSELKKTNKNKAKALYACPVHVNIIRHIRHCLTNQEQLFNPLVQHIKNSKRKLQYLSMFGWI